MLQFTQYVVYFVYNTVYTTYCMNPVQEFRSKAAACLQLQPADRLPQPQVWRQPGGQAAPEVQIGVN